MSLYNVASAARWAGVFLSAAPLVNAAVPSLQAGHAVTLADMLQVEEIHAVRMDPTGRRVLFRHSRYDSGDFSLEYQSDMAGEIFLQEIGGDATPRPLIRDKHDWDGERVLSFSPDGAYVAISWLQRGDLKVGVYAFARGQLIEVPVTPAFLLFSPPQQTLVWISEEEFVLSVLPAGERSGAAVLSRRAAQPRLAQLWEDAWRGDRATADVLESHAGYPPWPNRNGALVRVNARTGDVATLAQGIYFGLSLSPDHRYLAAAQQGGWHQPNPSRPLLNRDLRADFRRYDGVILDLKHAGELCHVAPGHQLMLSRYTWSWSADSTRVAFYATEGDRHWDEGNFFLFSLKDRRQQPVLLKGLVAPMVRDQVDYRFEQAVPFGGGLALYAQIRSAGDAKPASEEEGGPRADWHEVRPDGTHRNLTAQFKFVLPDLAGFAARALYVLADNDLWRIPETGAPVNLTASIESPLMLFSSRVSIDSEDSPPQRFPVYTTDLKHFLVLDQNGKVLSSTPLPAGIRQMFAVSPASGTAVIEQSYGKNSTVAVASRDGGVAPIWPLNTHLANVLPSKSISVTYKLDDGTEATTPNILLPADWVPGRRVPLVMEVYPGVTWGVHHELHPLTAELFASMGYAVATPFAPQDEIANAAGGLGHWAGLVLPTVDALIKDGYVDPERMAITGGSAGGWSAIAVITQTDRFRAAVAGWSTGNFIESYYGGISPNYWLSQLYPNEIFPAAPPWDELPGNPAGSPPSFGVPPWDDPMSYVRASPFFAVKRIRTPLMLVQSDMDGFSLDHFTEMFRALFRLRQEAQLVRYWGEAHGLTSPANLRDYWARTLAWLDKWCDVARDAEGRIVYDGERPKSRGTAAALRPEDFLKWQWFFGTNAVPTKKEGRLQ